MSQEPLKQPIVACQLGNLYNKESVIMFLLDKSSKSSDAAGKSKLADKFEHIRSRKDVKVNFMLNGYKCEETICLQIGGYYTQVST